MPSFAGLSKFFGRTVSEGAAFAAGVAVAPALEPVVREVVNEAWSKYQTMPLQPGDWAEIVGEDVEQLPQGETEAKKHGIKPSDFDALVQAVLNAPGVPELLILRRRGFIDDAGFSHGLRKARLEPRWDAALRALMHVPLEPAVIALGIVRDTIPDPGLQVGAHSTAGSDIPQGDQFPGDVLAEFAASGVTEDRARVMVQNIGLPMPPVRAANAFYRGIINKASYYLSVAQSDSRPAWADAILEEARQIPSVVNYVEAFVRNWISHDAMLAGAARHGMSADDAELLFLTHGRPLTHTQVFIALLRGGQYDGPTDMIDPPFLKSLQESDMRPEWYNLTWFARYHFPPFFQTVNALSKGWIDAATATDWLLKQAYDPEAVKTIVANVSAGGGGKSKTLTPSQVRSALRDNAITETDALARLTADGYSDSDARIFLSLPASGS